jgi:hypothetical protein
MDPQSIQQEALSRIEWKLDLLLHHHQELARALRQIGVTYTAPMISMQEPMACPVCADPVRSQVDLEAGVVYRQCGCGTGRVASKITVPVEAQNARSRQFAFTNDGVSYEDPGDQGG